MGRRGHPARMWVRRRIRRLLFSRSAYGGRGKKRTAFVLLTAAVLGILGAPARGAQQASTAATTTPQSGGSDVNSALPVGTTVTDHAVIVGASGFGNVTGSMKFFVCKPSQTTGGAGSERCKTSGSAAGSVSVTPVPAANPPRSTANSSNVLADRVGVWCFRAVYVSDSSSYSGSRDSSHGECFTVVDSATSTTTTPQSGGSDVNSALPLGTTVTDHAVIVGASGFGNVTGSMKFFVCKPSQTTGGAGSERCKTGGSAAGSVSVTPVPAVNPPRSTANSSNVLADRVGVWCFRAIYVSDSSRYTGSRDFSHGECFTVHDS